jgi:hypothetical protein
VWVWVGVYVWGHLGSPGSAVATLCAV